MNFIVGNSTLLLERAQVIEDLFPNPEFPLTMLHLNYHHVFPWGLLLLSHEVVKFGFQSPPRFWHKVIFTNPIL